MISTPFWIGTGFMKWVLMTREAAERSVGSFVVEAAILVMDMEEVLVARIAWGGQIRASLEKIEALRSGISLIVVSSGNTRFSANGIRRGRTGTASMTKSTSERLSRLVVELSRSRAAVASSFDIRCFETSFSKSLSNALNQTNIPSGTQGN